MDLNQKKTALKKELPQMGIPYVIEALKLIIPSGVEKHNMLINFEIEYDDSLIFARVPNRHSILKC
jgi:hypothetical protein